MINHCVCVVCRKYDGNNIITLRLLKSWVVVSKCCCKICFKKTKEKWLSKGYKVL